MTIQIKRWQPVQHQGNVIATFNFQMGEITVRAALFQRRGSGYDITMPFTQHFDEEGRCVTAVGLTYDRRKEVLAAAVACYESNSEYMPRGVWRADVAVEETMVRAGL